MNYQEYVDRITELAIQFMPPGDIINYYLVEDPPNEPNQILFTDREIGGTVCVNLSDVTNIQNEGNGEFCPAIWARESTRYLVIGSIFPVYEPSIDPENQLRPFPREKPIRQHRKPRRGPVIEFFDEEYCLDLNLIMGKMFEKLENSPASLFTKEDVFKLLGEMTKMEQFPKSASECYITCEHAYDALKHHLSESMDIAESVAEELTNMVNQYRNPR